MKRLLVIKLSSEFLTVAARLLEVERRPLTPRQLVELAFERRLFSDKVAGLTPHQTMKSKLAQHVKKHGTSSMFVRTKPGHFSLRKLTAPTQVYLAEPLQIQPSKEKVVVFPANRLPESRRFQGIRTRVALKLIRNLVGDRPITIERSEAEFTETYKQVITYVIVTRDSRVLTYKRGQYSHADQFLKGRFCIGFGGHVSEADHQTLFGAEDGGILNCAARELREEIKLPEADILTLAAPESLQIIGVLNDDSSENGRRHFGVVCRYEVSDDPSWDRPRPNERSVTQLHWFDPNAPQDKLFDFEYWSQLCLLKFFPPDRLLHFGFRVRRIRPLRAPHILVMSGTIASGKTAATRILQSDFGYTEINSGQVLADEIGLPPVPKTDRDTFQRAAWDFISTPWGPEQLARAIWRRIQEANSERVVVDGIRQVMTLVHLVTLSRPRRVGTISVYSPPNVAFQFYRRRSEGRCSIADFVQQHDAPVERDVQSISHLADAVLFNWRGGVSELRRVIHDLMTQASA